VNLIESIDGVSGELEQYSKTLDAESAHYWEVHEKRFRYTTQLVGELLAQAAQAGQPIQRALDIGNSYQTVMVNRIWPGLRLDTLGFRDPRYVPRGETIHFDFDLNDAYHPEQRIRVDERDKYDLILLLEVLEHLYTAPETILEFLGSLLGRGGRIVIQTPNAAALINRLRLLLGYHPYDLIRTTRHNPGHFREYTQSEIRKFAAEAGFVVEDLRVANYFVEASVWRRLACAISTRLPASFRTGMTIVLRQA
jgi:SAM-dependent methyltransferase